PVTVTAAVAVWPEQTAPAPHVLDAGVIVNVLKMGAGCTVAVAWAWTPVESVTVIVTEAVADTLEGSSTMVPVLVDEANGRSAGLLVTTRYGDTPPSTSSDAGVLAYTVMADGAITSVPGGAGCGAYGLFGAPLPPPQPPRSASAASASVARAGRSQRAFKRFCAMSESLMMLS